jgi:integrase
MEQAKRSTFKLLFYLKKNDPKKNGNVPIMGRVTIDGTPKAFSTKLDIGPNNWDLNHGRVLGKSGVALSINHKLESIRLRITNIYENMLKEEGFATAQKVKLMFLGVGVMDDAILKVFKEHNEEFERMVTKNERVQNTLNKYKDVYKHLNEFIKVRYFREDLAFRELNSDFMMDFEHYLRIDQECSHNTVWIYMMPVLRMVQIAIKKGLIRSSPFQDYKISMQETDRGYLLREQIEQIIDHISSKKRYELVKDLFIFSCFTGLSFVDIKNLRKNNIQSFFDGHQWIISRRQKSKATSNVRLMEIPKRLINKYLGITRNDFIFPVPDNKTCNNHLKKLIEEAGIISEKKITFHTARHTFATMFLTEGVPIESLSKMMGHKSISTTQIYAKITSQKISKDMDLVSHKFAGIEAKYKDKIEEV